MKRPLEQLPPLDPAFKKMLSDQLATRWFEDMALAVKTSLRRATQLPVHSTHYHTEHPLIVYRDKEEVMDHLGLNGRIDPLSEQILAFPPEAPAIDQTRHFAQAAVAWEPVSDEMPIFVKADKTLIVEVGAGHHLLSLIFTPLRADASETKMQMDKLTLRYGHDVYDVELNHSEFPEENIKNVQRYARLMGTAQATIKMIYEDYALAETVLTDGCRPVLESMRAENEMSALRQPRPAAISHNTGNSGCARPQEP